MKEKLYGYVIEEMAETPMYAKSEVNIRRGPSAEEEKIGSLAANDTVAVTGLTNTNWYRINYESQPAFVSAGYLVNELPASAKNDSKPLAKSTEVETPALVQGDVSDAYLVYSEAEIIQALSSGDMDQFNAMLQANIDAADAKLGTNWGSGSVQPAGGDAGSVSEESSGSTLEKSTSDSREFADYLNQKRQEEGSTALAWSDSLAVMARARAEEIVDDFSHNGTKNSGGEIIQKSPSSDVADWFDAFYESGGHRVNMMHRSNSEVGAAVCHYGNYYYIVVLFDI